MNDVRPAAGMPATVADFLDWPGDGRAKHYQLVDGEIRAMAPASVVHGIIQLTLGSLIRAHLRGSGSPCTALTEPAIRPRLGAAFNVRVPDIAVTCRPVQSGQVILDDPVILVEILSPSNRAKTWTNVWAYATLPSVKEIVIVHSTRVEIQVLRPTAERIWPETPETILGGDPFRLDSIGFRCPVEHIYSDTPLA